MSDHELIQQWKNPHTRTADTDHPAGDIVLNDLIVGGAPPKTEFFLTAGCCPTYTTSENC